MKIFSAEQIKAWDRYTIEHEPISSLLLMERASSKVTSWIKRYFTPDTHFIFFCGNGNNGGDGLAVARMLHESAYHVHVYMLSSDRLSDDCQLNLKRLKEYPIPISIISSIQDFPSIKQDDVIVDALFGTGLHTPIKGLHAELIHHINKNSSYTISIDVPSGLFCDKSSIGSAVIKANTTLSFQLPKLSFFWPENEMYVGNVEIIDIGLHKSYYESTRSNYYLINHQMALSCFKKRPRFGHKYTFGNALIVAGSQKMMGAALLCAKACLRSGAGLVTIPVEENRASTINMFLPEALVSFEKDYNILIENKKAVAFGPGIETTPYNENFLECLLHQKQVPVVIDASGLHILSKMVKRTPDISLPHVILTPHLGEFEALFGKDHNDYERMNTCLRMAKKLDCIIILKGHHSVVALPDGELYYNTTGNSGMATAGSGDVLTGIITGLLAQGYNPKSACILGVYCHGLAGDLGAQKLSQQSLIAGDIIQNLGEAFLTLEKQL